MTCTSMCRARDINSSTYTSPLPKAAFASDWQRANAAATSSTSSTIRIPRPPPPAMALMIIPTPRPSEAWNASAWASVTAPGLPRRTGTPCCVANERARALSPSNASVSTEGPTNVMPATAQSRAKSGFSARKPYPGWRASHPLSFATAKSWAASRYAAAPVPRSGCASSIARTWSECASSSENTATVPIPSSEAARPIRIAISARLAMSSLCNIWFLS